MSPTKRTKTIEFCEDNCCEDQAEQDRTSNGTSNSLHKKCRTHRQSRKKEQLISVIDVKKRVDTPKLVNFSFGLHQTTTQKRLPEKNNVLSTKINFFDVTGHCKEELVKH